MDERSWGNVWTILGPEGWRVSPLNRGLWMRQLEEVGPVEVERILLDEYRGVHPPRPGDVKALWRRVDQELDPRLVVLRDAFPGVDERKLRSVAARVPRGVSAAELRAVAPLFPGLAAAIGEAA